MPHIRIRGVKNEVVQKFSDGMNDELAKVMQTSPDNFTVEAIQTQFFNRGQADAGYPFVEVFWFERTPEIKEQAARYITDRLRAITGAPDIAVVFREIEKTDYFENGSHF